MHESAYVYESTTLPHELEYERMENISYIFIVSYL